MWAKITKPTESIVSSSSSRKPRSSTSSRRDPSPDVSRAAESRSRRHSDAPKHDGDRRRDRSKSRDRQRSRSRERHSTHDKDKEERRRHHSRRATDPDEISRSSADQPSSHDAAASSSREDGKRRRSSHHHEKKRERASSRATADETDRAGEFQAQVGAQGFTQFPGQYDAALPGAGAPRPTPVSSHVPDQFPGQFPAQSTAPYRPPLGINEGGPGLAADYYGDQGESVLNQPGVRPPASTVIVGTQPHLQSASATPAPPPEPSAVGGVGAAASFFSGEGPTESPQSSFKPPKPGKTNKPSKVSGSAVAAGTAALGYAVASSGPSSSSSHHGSSQAHSTSAGISRPPAGGNQSASAPIIPTLGAAAAGAAAGYMAGQYGQSGGPPQSDQNSAYFSAASNIPSRPAAHPGPFNPPPPQPGPPSNFPSGEASGKHSGHSNAGLYAAGAVGAAALAAHQLHHSSSHHSVGGGPSSGNVSYKHRPKGPLSRIANFWRDPDGVAQFEEYTEYIGVCRYCFSPDSSPRDAPRVHHYKRGKRVDKERRYDRRYSSDSSSGKRRNKSWIATGLAGYGIAKFGKSLWNSRDFDDTYSVKSGRSSTASLPGSLGGKSKVSRGNTMRRSRSSSRHRGDSVVIGRSRSKERHRSRSKDRVETGITGDGRAYRKDLKTGVTTYVEDIGRRRSRSRSRSRSRHRQDGLVAAGIGISSIGISSAVASHSRHRSRGTSPRRDFVREKRTKSRERDSHHDRQHSYHADISRSNRTSNTGMLGGFFSAPSEKRRRKSPSKRSKKGIFNIGSNSSSSDLDMAFGTGNDRSKKSQKSQKSDRKSRRSDDAAILGLSAAAVAIAAGQSGRGKHDKRMPELVAVKESKNRPQGHPERSGRGHGSAHSPDASGPGDEDWESATDDEGSSASDLAFGSFYDKGKLPHRRSRGSLTSDASSSSGNWGRLWGSKRSKKRGETSYTSDSASRTQSFIGPASAGLAGAAVGAVRVDRRASGPDVAGSSVSSSFAPLRQLYPVPTSDPNSFDARQRESISSFQNLPLHTSRPGPVPVQHPQPYTPVSSAVFAGQIPASPGYTAPTGPPVFSQAPIQPYRPESQAALVDSPKTYRSNDPFNYQVKDDAWETENASRDTVGGLQRRKSSLSNGAAAATAITEPKRRTTAPNEPSGVRFDLTKEQAEKQAREAGKSSERPREEGESKRDRAKRREAEEKAALEKVRESSRPERRRSRDAEPPSSSRTEAYRDDDGKSNDAWVAPVEAGMVGAAMAVAAANPSSSRGEARQERRRNDDGQPRYEALYDVKRDEQDRTAGEGYRQTDIARKAASKVVASRAQEVQSVLDKYTGTQQTQAEFFAPPELLDKSADRSQPTVPVFDSDFMSFDVPQIIEVAPPDAFAGPTHPPSFSLNAASMSLPWMVPRLNLISPTPMPRSPLLLPADAPGASAPSPEKSPPSQEPWDAKRTAERTVGSESESQERSKPKDAGSEPKRHHREEQPEAPVSGFGHVPGEFGDDVDFAASLAAGLQDSGFDPSIVTDNPSYWRRDSPPGSEGPGGYKKPFSETVSDLGSFAPDVTAVKTAPPSRDHGERRIEGDSELRKQELRGSDESKVSKQEGKKGRKAASRVLDEEAVEAKQSELARTSVDPPGAYNAVAESETYFDATSIPENESSELVRDKSRRMKDDVPPVPREAASGIAGVAAGVLAAMKSTGIPRSAESDRASEDYDQREQASDDVERSKKQGRKSKGERGATNEEPGTPVENSSETGQPRGAAEAGVDQYEELTRNGKKSKGRDLTEDIQVDVAQSKGQWPGEAPDSFPESYEEPRRKGKKSKKIASKNGVASDLPGVAPGAKSDELDEPMRKGKKSKSRGNDDPSPDAERLSRLTLGASESTFNDHEEPKRKGKKSKRRPTDEPLDDSEGPSQLTSGASGFEANAYEEPSRKSEKSRSKSAADSNDTRVSVRDSSAAASGNFEEPKRKSKKSKSKANSDDFYDDLDRSTRSANDGAERGIPDLSDDPEDRKSRMSRENKDKRKSRGDEVLETGRITQDQEIKAPNSTATRSQGTDAQGTNSSTRTEENAARSKAHRSTADETMESSTLPETLPRLTTKGNGSASVDILRGVPETAPMDLPLHEVPPLPDGRPSSPARLNEARDLALAQLTGSVSPSTSLSTKERGLGSIRTPENFSNTSKGASPTAVPLSFGRKLNAAGGQRPLSWGTPVRSISADAPPPRPRPSSTSSKEFRPLYLVERHASKHEIERGEEQYPPLPSSHATSRTPSVDDAEEGTMDRGFQKEPLVFNDLDFGQPNRDKIMGDDVARPAPDVLDSAKSTPRAETFRTQLGMERGTEDIPSWEKFSDSHQGLVENDRQAVSTSPLRSPSRLFHSAADLFPNRRAASPISPSYLPVDSLPPLPLSRSGSPLSLDRQSKDTSGVSQASELLAKDAEAGFQTDQNEEDAAESGWSTSKPPQSKEDDKTKKAKKGKNRKGQAVSPRDESPLRDASVEAANVEVLTDVDTVVPLGEKAPGLEEQTPVQAAEGLSSLTKKSKKDKKGKKGKATATPEPPEVPLPTPSTPKTMEVSSVAPKSAVLSALVEAATKVPDQANKGGITSREPSRPEDEVILVPETKKSKKEKKSKKKKGVDTPPLNIIDAPSGLTMMDTDLEKPSGKAASELAASESVAELDVEYVTPGKKNKKKGKKALGISPPQAFGSASSLAAGQTVAQVESSQGRSEERGLDEVAGPDDKFTEIEKSQKAILVSASEKIKSLTTASERQIVDGEVSSRPIPDSVAKTNRDSLARGSEHNGQGTGNLTQQAQGAMVNSSKLDDETVEEMVRAPEPVTVIPTEAVDVKFSMPGAMKTEKGQKSLLLSGPDEIDTPTTGDRVAEERPSELLADAADSGDVNATFSTRGNKEKEGRRADLASPPRGLESPLKEVIADEPSTSRREDKIPDKDLEFSTPGKKKKKGKKGLVSQTPDDTDFASPPAVNKVVLEETEPSMKTALTSIPGDEFASLLPGKKSKTKGKRPSFTSEPDESENRSASSDKGVLVEDSSKEIAAATVGLGESFDASFPTTVKKKNGKKAQRASVVAQTQASVVENGAEVTTSHHGSESKVSEADQVTDLSVVQDGPAGDRRSPAEQSRRLDPEVMSSFLSRDEEQAILPQSVPLPTTDDDDLNELPGLREVGDFSVPLQQSLSVQDEIDGASRPVVQDPEQAKPLDPTSIPLPLGDELEIRELIDDIPPILDLAGSRANLRSQAPAPLPVLLPVAQKQSISAPGRNFADDPIRDRGEAKEPPEPEGGTGGFWGLLTKKGKRDKAAESTKKTDAPSKLEQATTNPQASEQISHEKSPGPSGQRLPETQFLTQAATSQLENVEPHEHDRNADSPKPEASDTPEASADHEAEVRGDESWTTSSKKKDKKSKKSRRAFEPAVDLAVVDSVRDLDQGAKSADARGTALENQPGWKDKKDLKKGKKAREVKNKPSDNLAEASAPEHVRNLPPERVSREDVPISIPTEKDDAREGVEQIIPEETVQPLSETLTPKRSKKNKKAKAGRMSYDEPKEPAASKEILEASENLSTRKVVERDLATFKTTKEPAEAEVARDEIEGDLVLNKLTPKENKKARTASRKDDEPIKPFESIPSSKGEDDLATRDRSLQDLVAAETASEKVVDKITADSKPSKNDEEVKKSKSRLLADGEGHRIPDALPAPEVTTRRDEQPGETASNLFGEQFHFNAAPRLERPVEKAQTRIVDADNHQVSGEQANRFVMPGSFDSPSDTAPQRQELDSRRGERPVDIVPGFARKASLATAAGIALFESLTKGKTSLQTETAKVDSAKEETRPAAIVDPENATTRAIVDRDSAIAVAESPTQSSRTSQQAFVRDSGYQDASPSAAAKQGQFPASAESVIESREAPRDGHDRDTSLEIDSTIRKRTESQESSESRRRADTMEGSTGPLDITVEMDPTYELSISRHSGDRARSKSGSRKSVEISWQPEEALWDSNENSNVDKSRNVGPPRSTEDLPPPSPITSTSKDRNSYLFNSSPSTRDDQANQQASRVRSTSQTDRQIIPDLGPATGEGGDGQGPHEHHAKDNERDDAYDVPRDTTSRSVSSRGVAQAEQPARPSLFGGPIGVNSDRQSAPVTSAEFTPPERRRLNTIREQSPDESPRTRRVRGERRDELRYDAQREDSSPLQLKHPLGKNLTPATDPERRAKDNKLVSTDELISRLSWPSVDENEETVNIERVKSRDTDRRASSRHSDRSASVPKPRETDRRSPGVHSDLSDASVQRLQTPDREPFRPQSELSNRSNGSSGTPPLRRIDRSLSGDLRAASRLGQAKLAKDAIGPASHVERDRNNTHDPTPSSSSYDPVRDKGKGRDRSMADVYEGWGDVQGSPLSPTRPPSMRRRQSMQLMELEGKFEQLAQDNRQLEEARARAEKTAYDAVYEKSRAAEAAAEALQSRDQLLHERDSEIEQLKELLDRLRGEVSRLTEVTEGLRASGDGHEERYGLLQAEHAATRGSLEELRQVHGKLSTGMETVVRQEIDSALADKSAEVRRLRDELETTRGQVRTLQQQLLASKPGDNFLTVRDEDYFEGACQQLCQHVQQFVLRFSKFSDMRGCRLADEVRDDSIFERLDNAILDGSDVDGYLADRVKRRDVFMSVVMMMVWESIFARYLFGMDREQRQKLKALEKILAEVGPPAAVHQWRATTLTLLSRREAFQAQREQDTEVVVQDVYHTLAALLPPPSNLTGQIQDSLRKVMRAAVELSIEMRTQRAGYMMLPPLQPEYDASGELERQVQFRASLMNERSGATTSNEELEERGAIVRMVLFPLVVKRGEDDGTGDDEIVVCPAQVLVAPLHAGKERESGSGKKVVRVLSGDRMSLDERSMAQSSAMDLGNMI